MRGRALASFCVLACALAAADGASAETLAQALDRVGVQPAERSADLAVAAHARRVARRVGGARGRAIRVVLASTAALLRRDGVTPALARIAFLELHGNAAYLASRRLPSTGARVRIDGVVYESYAGQGLRIQPLGTYFAILEPGAGVGADGGSPGAMLRAQAIVLDAGDEARLPYLFPWSGMTPPWYSAMAEGVAASAGLRAWRRSGQPRFLDLAIRFGNAALARAIPTADGVWFPLYAPQPGYRVLNAHLQTVIAMADLARATGDDAYADAYARGVAATRATLSDYDTGGWGRYAPGEDAPVKYMELMARQLRRLGALTGDGRFTRLGVAFGRDLERRPVVHGPRGVIDARRHGRRRPTVDLTIRRDKPVALVITVTTPRGRATAVPPLALDLGSGTSVVRVDVPRAAGRYTVRATAVDWAGNRRGPIRLAAIRVRR